VGLFSSTDKPRPFFKITEDDDQEYENTELSDNKNILTYDSPKSQRSNYSADQVARGEWSPKKNIQITAFSFFDEAPTKKVVDTSPAPFGLISDFSLRMEEP
jgi:hypothetical protein